jgi:hypothetical protein
MDMLTEFMDQGMGRTRGTIVIVGDEAGTKECYNVMIRRLSKTISAGDGRDSGAIDRVL